MKRTGSLIALVGGAALAVAAFLPWIQVRGLAVRLDLLGIDRAVLDTSVAGADTDAGAIVIGAGVLVVLLALRCLMSSKGGLAQVGLIGVGGLAALAGVALFLYAANLVAVELRDRTAVERTAAELVVEGRALSGVYVLVASGIVILSGALLSRR